MAFSAASVERRGRPTPKQTKKVIEGDFDYDDYPGESPFETKFRDKIAAKQEEKRQANGQK